MLESTASTATRSRARRAAIDDALDDVVARGGSRRRGAASGPDAALLDPSPANALPHLARAEPRVVELLDQRRRRLPR